MFGGHHDSAILGYSDAITTMWRSLAGWLLRCEGRPPTLKESLKLMLPCLLCSSRICWMVVPSGLMTMSTNPSCRSRTNCILLYLAYLRSDLAIGCDFCE